MLTWQVRLAFANITSRGKSCYYVLKLGFFLYGDFVGIKMNPAIICKLMMIPPEWSWHPGNIPVGTYLFSSQRLSLPLFVFSMVDNARSIISALESYHCMSAANICTQHVSVIGSSHCALLYRSDIYDH